jgi:hypothetical protein
MLNMKHYFSVFTHRHIALIILLSFATPSLFLPISSSAGNVNVGEELISLTVKNEPLGDVLYKVSMATGYDISIDDKWQNYRVTASLEDVSLHRGLKRILRNLNSAIIYVSSKKIKIIIYDKTASEDESLAPSTEKSLERTPDFQPPPGLPLEHRLPTSQTIEEVDRSKTDEEPSDNPVVSGQESETSGPDREGEDNSTKESSEQDNSSESKNE